MYGQMTAGSWIYIGTQGILQGTYETFAAVAREALRRHPCRHAHRDRRLRRHGRRAAAGGDHERRGRAGRRRRPVAPASAACRRPLPRRVDRRPRRRGRARAERPKAERRALERRARRQLPRRCCRSCCAAAWRSTSSPIRPPRTTRSRTCRSASRSTTGTRTPSGTRSGFTERAQASMAAHVEAMVGFMDAGAEVFDYGNSIRAGAELGGYDARVGVPGLRARLHPAALLRGQGPVPLGGALGRPGRHRTPPTRPCSSCSPTTSALHRWIAPGSREGRVPGAARAHLLARLRRARQARAAVQRDGRRRTRSPRRSSSAETTSTAAASPRPTARPRRCADGSDAIADWPLLNALVNTASGATWVSIHHGGGVGIGRSIHAGQVTVADGTPLAAEKIERVLTNDPAWASSATPTPGYEHCARGRAGARRARPDARGSATERRERRRSSPASASSSPTIPRSATGLRSA